MMVIIVVISDKSPLFKIILVINPLSNGFISYLMGTQFGIWGLLISICLIILILIIAKHKFKVWDLY